MSVYNSYTLGILAHVIVILLAAFFKLTFVFNNLLTAFFQTCIRFIITNALRISYLIIAASFQSSVRNS
jgi:hypothetical protein